MASMDCPLFFAGGNVVSVGRTTRRHAGFRRFKIRDVFENRVENRVENRPKKTGVCHRTLRNSHAAGTGRLRWWQLPFLGGFETSDQSRVSLDASFSPASAKAHGILCPTGILLSVSASCLSLPKQAVSPQARLFSCGLAFPSFLPLYPDLARSMCTGM
jgi:hypothetical protein